MIDRQRALQLDRQEQRVRIGAVTYLNSKPLIEGLAALCPHADIILDYPSHLADDLSQCQLDAALIPSIESFGNPDYEIISDACVATHSEVFSVKMYSRVHPGAIRTLALDEGSRTSAALTRIMLAERFGVTPELKQLPLGKTTRDSNTDAVLLIGDRAMKPVEESFHTVWDLGLEWVQWTGLPFVFAMWVARKESPLNGIAEQLSAARDLGLQNVAEIARRGAKQLDLPEEMVLRYLTKNLHFKIGPAERAGLKLFQELAIQHGICEPRTLRFRIDAMSPSETRSDSSLTSC